MIINHSLGVLLPGDSVQLALLVRRLNKTTVLDFLTLGDFRQKPPAEIRNQVITFLQKNKVSRYRCVLVVPRHNVIVRQLELPKEAEANLAKVVEYQVVNLVPSEDAAACYDFCVSKAGTESKTLQVAVFLVLRSLVEDQLTVCEKLGLTVDCILPSSLAIANYFLLQQAHFKSNSALLGYVGERCLETVGISSDVFRFSRETRIPDEESLSDLLKGDVEHFRGQARLPEDVTLEVFLIGNPHDQQQMPSEDGRFKMRRITGATGFGLQVAKAELEGRKLEEYFLAMVGAVCGLRKKLPLSLNLLPPERRVKKPKWVWAPTYGLAGINLLLLLALTLRGPLQQQLFSKRLSREVSRLEPEVRKIQSVEKEISNLQRRTELLATFKKSNRLPLEVLNEVSKILPKNAWVLDFNMKKDVIELSGPSDEAAALPQILDNSPYFRDAEFVAPIVKDANGKEVYRIRMKMELVTKQ